MGAIAVVAVGQFKVEVYLVIVEKVRVCGVVAGLFPDVSQRGTRGVAGCGGVGVVVPSPHGCRDAPHSVVYHVAAIHGVAPCGLGGVYVAVGGVHQRVPHAPVDGDGGNGLRSGEVAVVGSLQFEHVVGHNVCLAGPMELPADVLVALVLVVQVGALFKVSVGSCLHVVNLVVGGYVHHVGP